MDTIENAFVIQDDNHVVYRGSDHFLMFHVTNGKRFIHVHSNIGYINPFCRYIFYGRYSDQKNFRANDCSMTPTSTFEIPAYFQTPRSFLFSGKLVEYQRSMEIFRKQ